MKFFPSRFFFAGTGLAIGFAGIIIGGGLFAVQTGAVKSETKTEATPVPVVLQQVKALATLNTAEFRFQATVPMTETSMAQLPFGLGSVPYAQAQVTYMGTVKVIAGIDFSRAQVTEGSLTAADLILPVPAIQYIEIDGEKTLSESQVGFGVKTSRLTHKARAEARRQAIEAACAQGILDRAEAKAAEIASKLVQSLGRTDVSVSFQGDKVCVDPFMPTPTSATTAFPAIEETEPR